MDDALLCTICFEMITQTNDIILLSCGHLLHRSCLMKWLDTKLCRLKRTCPECRSIIYRIDTQQRTQQDSNKRKRHGFKLSNIKCQIL